MYEFIKQFIQSIPLAFGYTLVFGGFLLIPVFSLWFYAILYLLKSRYFYAAWIPLLLTGTAFFLVYLSLIYKDYKRFMNPMPERDSGPISAFPFPDFFDVYIKMMGAFTCIISPLLLVIAMAFLVARKIISKSEMPNPKDSW